MKLNRRRFTRLAAAAVALPAVSRFAWAQTYPTRPVRLIVPFAAGGPLDIQARLMAQWLSNQLDGQFVVENRAGAGGNIGTEDSHKGDTRWLTFLIVGASNTINPSLYAKLNFDPVRDLLPVANIGRVAGIMEVHPSVPAQTVPEFIALAKANPGTITMASGGVGTFQHLAGELFKMMAGVDLIHVPYRGAGPALTDLVAGQVQMMIDSITSSIEHVKAGRLRALGLSSAARWDMLPDIPAVAEFVPGYEAIGLAGVMAPRGTPVEIVERLNGEINRGLANPTIKARLAEWGLAPIPGSPADFGKFFAQEVEQWRKVISFSGAKAE